MITVVQSTQTSPEILKYEFKDLIIELSTASVFVTGGGEGEG